MDIPVLISPGGEHQELQSLFGGTLIEVPAEDYYLCFEKNQWMVRNQKLGRHFTLSMDFDKEINKIKKQKISVKKDLLCRAVGFKGEDDYRVVDGTLGLAKDSLHLIAQGAHVIGFERNPVVYALAKSALKNSQVSSEQFSICFQDILEGLDSLPLDYDCLFLDPMFEMINEKSAPKKNMAFLRQLELQVGDFDKIIEKASNMNIPRIAVKRPLRADYLYKKPNSIVEGKIVRYDIYLR